MKKHLPILLLIILMQVFYTAFAQATAPNIVWQKTLGGSKEEVLTSMCTGADKSVVLCGYSNSGVSGNKTNASIGGYDYWIIKLDASGNVVWNKTYGGKDDDFASAIIATADGGYLVGGSSISEKTGSKSFKSYGFSYDYWILKLDVNGNKVWDVTRGGLYTEKLTALAELPTGGYLAGGYSYSNRNGSKTTANLASETNADYWVVVLNNNGTERTQHLFGGQGHDVLTCLAPVGTNSYYAVGYSYSKKGNTKIVQPFGNNDYFVVRSNLNGKYDYQGNFGSKLSDFHTCMQVLPDRFLILGGYSNSSRANSKSDNFYGVMDYWMVKVKPDGTKQWDKTFSGSAGSGYGGDYMVSVQQTKDKGFILGGYSNSKIGNSKTENSKGGYDYWIIKTDSTGKKQWDKTIGGSHDDKLTAIYEVDKDEYILAGTSASAQSGDKSSGVIGGSSTDYWVVRLGSTSSSKKLTTEQSVLTNKAATGNGNYKLDIMPNPVRDILTVRYSTAENSKVDFAVYAANGKVVLQSGLAASYAGSVRSFKVNNLPAGSYFAVMYAGDVKLTKTFTKE